MSRPEPNPNPNLDPNPNQTQIQQTDLYTELPQTQPWVLDDGEVEPEPQPQPQPAPAPAPQPQPQPAPAPEQQQRPPYSHVHTLPTGHTFYGNSEAEILSQVSQFAAQQLHPTQSQAALDYARRSMTPAGTYSYQQPAQPPAFDKESFYRNLVADPVSAIHQALQNYLGVDDPREVINYSYETSRTINREQEVGRFHQMNPDFPASPAAGNMIMDRLESDGHEPTAWNLTVAYQQLVREGRLAPVQARPNGQTQPQYQAQPQPQPNYYQAPAPRTQPQSAQRGRRAPLAPGSQPSSQDTPVNQMTPHRFENMSADEQLAWMRKNNVPM